MSEDNRDVPWLEPVEEEGPETSFVERFRMVIIAAGIVVIFAFALIVWQVYNGGGSAPAGGEVPLVKAPAGPEKTAPEQPGGMDIPDRDKMVYNRVGGDGGNAQASATLRPGPEAPMDKPQAGAPSGNGATVPAAPAAPSPSVSPMHSSPAAPASATVPASPAAASNSTGDYLIQLGAFSSRDRAMAAWKKIQGAFPSMLANMDADVMTIDRGGKGVLYRLQAGRVADRGSAETLCSSLKSKGQPCMVVHR